MGKYDAYVTFDEPIPYRSLLIHPVTMRESLQFMQLAPVLLLDIYSIPDPKILSMKYLEYLFHIKEYDEELKRNTYPYLDILYLLFQMVLKLEDDDRIEFFEPDGISSFRIGKDVFDKTDFEIIREIIIEQNSLSPPNHKIDKVLREKMEEARAIRAKMNGNKKASMEDQMIALMTSTGISLDDVYNLTIRKFSKALERVDHTLHYKIYLAASMSGMVKFKNKSFIKHWLTNLEKDEFSELLDYDSVEKEITVGNS